MATPPSSTNNPQPSKAQPKGAKQPAADKASSARQAPSADAAPAKTPSDGAPTGTVDVSPNGESTAAAISGKGRAEAAATAATTDFAKPDAAQEPPATPPEQTAPGPSGKPKPNRRESIREELEQLESVGKVPLVMLIPSWLFSAIVHMIVLLIFGLIVIPEPPQPKRDLVALPVERTQEVQKIADLPVADVTQIDASSTAAMQIESTSELESIEVSDEVDLPAALASVELSDIGLEQAPASDLLGSIGSHTGKGLSGRSEAARKALVIERGGSEASETAVALALKWFAEHQNADGGWSFDHRSGRCQDRCGDPGSLKTARLAATGMALLPFLGAGQTHKEGEYKDQVRGGLYFLGNHMAVGPNGGDMTAGGGQMYGHGIASIALCEAYAMTQDKQLFQPAQLALNFIMFAQDDTGGGWRYSPNTPGDTSVVGWQIMALKSGYLGFLEVNPQTIRGAAHFLDSVQSDGGAAYGYTGPSNSPTLTAVGLLCRMHMGWRREEPALERGVQYLANLGPQGGNMYFNYYATQVLHHFEGKLWEGWNAKMRDFLVNSQSKKGHETGSWFFRDDSLGGPSGGRVYCTSMAAMTLEVYYRHMPLYAQESAEEDFED